MFGTSSPGNVNGLPFAISLSYNSAPRSGKTASTAELRELRYQRRGDVFRSGAAE
jgi:hypothetical protein